MIMKKVEIIFDLSPDLELVDGILTLTEDTITAEYNSQKIEYKVKNFFSTEFFLQKTIYKSTKK